ncbi:hypothetical protein RB614_17580 [Phytohabitans sp. ZYX-F-186]|uniref:Uncharacterized protein n=1 Tax=Phytohabitans maris TaxID=3071409 RepID=A0ABU0ZH11_9ACTN|nr:hypothetical protein [Phytohabitans sp. ZYX-F-186]MDQ7906327.1 hypothetical protein [Phytohabitans sp. ZYX-F-186]
MGTPRDAADTGKRWLLEFGGIRFGGNALRVTGKAPDWAFLGLLVPFIVAGNLLLHGLGASTVPQSLAVSAASALLAKLVAFRTRRRAPQIRAMISALTASGGGVVKMAAGPLLIPAVPGPGATTLDSVAAGTLLFFILLHLVRELLVRTRPAKD